MKMNTKNAYEELLHRFRERALLMSAKAVLEWDAETYLPQSAVEYRGAQTALLAGLAHERLVDPRIKELLDAASQNIAETVRTSSESVNVRQWRRFVERQSRLDKRLVEEIASTASLAHHAWAQAYRRSDFSEFSPWLERIVQLKKEEGQQLSEGGDSWQALLDEFEPGMTTARVEELFRELEPFLIELIAQCQRARPHASRNLPEVSASKQREFCETIARLLRFDFAAGRLDTSTHPFSTHVGPKDTRITTRFVVDDPFEGLFGTIHEVGHGLYDQGLLKDHFGTPRGDAVSLAIHESQSRLWENLVARSEGFWRFMFPRLQSVWSDAIDGWNVADVLSVVRHVQPSAIRTSADEVTYNLHIFIRFDLERALMRGDLKVRELPSAWNEAYRNRLGITPTSDKEGCLQDGHWGAGLFGYFPTYTLGNLIAGQLYEAAETAIGDHEALFARGEFAPLLDWLRIQVHSVGQTFDAEELVKVATGKSLSVAPFMRLLKKRYDMGS